MAISISCLDSSHHLGNGNKLLLKKSKTRPETASLSALQSFIRQYNWSWSEMNIYTVSCETLGLVLLCLSSNIRADWQIVSFRVFLVEDNWSECIHWTFDNKIGHRPVDFSLRGGQNKGRRVLAMKVFLALLGIVGVVIASVLLSQREFSDIKNSPQAETNSPEAVELRREWSFDWWRLLSCYCVQGLFGGMTRGSIILFSMMMVWLLRMAIFSKGSWITKPAPKMQCPAKVIDAGST